MTSTDRTITAADALHVQARVDHLNERVARRGMVNPVTVTFSPVRWVEPDPIAPERVSGRVCTATISVAAPVLPGGWQIVALADFSAADSALVFNLVDDVDYRADAFDPQHCDHCGTRRTRHTVYVMRSEDGCTAQVGSTCAADFLGHNPAVLLHFAELLEDLDDDDNWTSRGGADKVPTAEFVAAAHVAVTTWGWRKASDQAPTRDDALRILFGRNDEAYAEARQMLADPAVIAFAEAAIAWAAQIDARSDFDENLKAIATSDGIGRKGYGVAAYLPVAYARHLDKAAEKAAEKVAATAAEEDATPAPTGRVEVSGTVIALATRDSGYGTTYKMTVRDDRGFRVWTTIPSTILADTTRGARVTLTVTLAPADDDKFFAFGTRPAKAAVAA